MYIYAPCAQWMYELPDATHRLCIAIEGCQVQWCTSVLVRLVYFCTFLNQKLDHCPVTLQTSPAQR